jgi:hypothetical protein
MTWIFVLFVCTVVAVFFSCLYYASLKPIDEANVELAEVQGDFHDLENLHEDVLKYLEDKVTEGTLPEGEVSEYIEKLNQFLKEHNEG